MKRFKVISCRATGVPLEGDGPYQQQLENGLNKLADQGWLFVGLLSSDHLVFRRTRPKKRRKTPRS
jgi:hypothetical protein